MATNTAAPIGYPANPARPDRYADQAWIRDYREEYDQALRRHTELLTRNPEAAHFYWAYAMTKFYLMDSKKDVLISEEKVASLEEQLEKWRLLEGDVIAGQTEVARWQREAARWKVRADQKQEEVASSKNEQQRKAQSEASAQAKYAALTKQVAELEAARKRLAAENEKLRRQLMVQQTGHGAPHSAPQHAPRGVPAASSAPAYAPAAVPSAPPAPLYAPTSGRADEPTSASQRPSPQQPLPGPMPSFAPVEPSPPPPPAAPPPPPPPPAAPVDGSPQGAFVRWCQEGGGLMGRAYRFAQASGLEVEAVFRECNALGVEFSAQPSDPAEYWLVRQGADLLLFPQPLSSNAFRELDERLFEPSGAQPRSLSQIVPCKVQRDGDNLHVVARGKIA